MHLRTSICIYGSLEIGQLQLFQGRPSPVSVLQTSGDGRGPWTLHVTALQLTPTLSFLYQGDGHMRAACTGCAGDCPFILKSCPANTTNGVPCSQNGWCMSASGVCECYFGYAGSDCSQCAEGYMRAP